MDPSYLTSSDLYAATYVYFAAPHFTARAATWSYAAGSEPFAAAELPSLLATNVTYGQITAPVLVLQGQFDLSACGGNCAGADGAGGRDPPLSLAAKARELFSGAKVVEVVDDLPAG